MSRFTVRDGILIRCQIMKGNKQREVTGNPEKWNNKDRWMKRQRKHHENTYEDDPKERIIRPHYDDDLEDDN